MPKLKADDCRVSIEVSWRAAGRALAVSPRRCETGSEDVSDTVGFICWLLNLVRAGAWSLGLAGWLGGWLSAGRAARWLCGCPPAAARHRRLCIRVHYCRSTPTANRRLGKNPLLLLQVGYSRKVERLLLARILLMEVSPFSCAKNHNSNRRLSDIREQPCR